MTRQERRAVFIAKFRGRLAGTIALGGEAIRKSLAGQCLTAEIVGDAMNKLGPTADSLLGLLFDDLLPAEPEKSTNGRAQEVQRK